MWDSLAADCADLEALAVFPGIRRAYDERLIDPQFMAPEELVEAESAHGRLLEATRTRRPRIDDVAAATSWWSAFGDRHDAHGRETALGGSPEPYRAPPKVGRNDPCPCGSGKKHKKCCGG